MYCNCYPAPASRSMGISRRIGVKTIKTTVNCRIYAQTLDMRVAHGSWYPIGVWVFVLRTAPRTQAIYAQNGPARVDTTVPRETIGSTPGGPATRRSQWLRAGRGPEATNEKRDVPWGRPASSESTERYRQVAFHGPEQAPDCENVRVPKRPFWKVLSLIAMSAI